MGWSKKRNRKKNKDGNKGGNSSRDDNNKKNPKDTFFKVTVPFSHKMEAYYAFQGLHNQRLVESTDADVKPAFVACKTLEEKEEERQRFMSSMSSILPASFRFGQNLDKELREQLESELQLYAGKEMEIEVCLNANGEALNMKNLSGGEEEDTTDATMKGTEEEDKKEDETTSDDKDDQATSNTGRRVITTIKKKVAPVKPLPFVPHGYQLSIDKKTIRRNPSLGEFHNWLKIQTEAGFITRQETVSMIPPVVLNVEPHHAVLDMCAAPGSKTTQILEIVGQMQQGDLEPKGFVVANDSDAKRAYLLTHQLRRLNNPACFITSSDAQFWPMIGGSTKHLGEEGIFDRVLCDVPCSGDGTARKNIGIWRYWTTLGAFGLHTLQLSIALNGARLTKVGGYMCYSTCSLNPIENEAVVSEILRLTKGSLELVDRREDLNGIITRPGWSSWKVVAEPRRRRDEKNYQKKNNAKMQQRRKEYAEKMKAEGAESSNGNDGNEPKDSSADTPMKCVDSEGEVKQDTNESSEAKKEPWVSVPPSWDEEALLKRCEDLGLKYYETFENVPLESRKRIRQSCFPPTKEEVEHFQLHKCFRTLPQDQNTGGFFTALFKKTAPLSERAKRFATSLAQADANGFNETKSDNAAKKAKMNNGESVKTDGDTEVTDEQDEKTKDDKETMNVDNDSGNKTTQNDGEGQKLLRGRRKTRGKEGNDDFIQIDADILPPLMEFYGLPKDFAQGRFMTRRSGTSKVLYFITESIKTNLIDQGIQGRITIINAGLRAFERGTIGKDVDVDYRPCQEAIHYVAPFMTKRKAIADQSDFQKCLSTDGIGIDQFSEVFAESLRGFALGAFVVALKGYEADIEKKMFLIMWKNRGETVNCFVTKAEQEGIKSKLKTCA